MPLNISRGPPICWKGESSLGVTYENKRAYFEVIRRRYDDYVALYREINGGSLEGVAPFDEFYWHLMYYSKYSNANPNDLRR